MDEYIEIGIGALGAALAVYGIALYYNGEGGFNEEFLIGLGIILIAVAVVMSM